MGSSVVWAGKNGGLDWAGSNRVGEVWGSAISHTAMGNLSIKPFRINGALTAGNENG